MLTPLKTEILKVADLVHEARRFRTILWSFERNMELLFKDSGLVAEVDHTALAAAFANWRQAFDRCKHLADVNRHDFVIYAAGLMLKELVAANPIRAVKVEVPTLPVDHRLKTWPEGYAYTSFCLSVAGAILKDMGEAAAATDDPQFWASFRENAAESPATAIAFFDLVCGQEPNWEAPDVPWMRASFMARKGEIENQGGTNVLQ